MLKNPPKTVLTARVEPELKVQLIEEADLAEMTLSNYTEHCLRNFNNILHNAQVCAEVNQILQSKIDKATSEHQELYSENQKLLGLNTQFSADNKAFLQQIRLQKEHIEFLTNQVQDLESVIEQREDDIHNLNYSLNATNQLNKNSALQIHSLDKEVVLQKNQISQHRADNNALSNRYEQSREAREKLRLILANRLPITFRGEEIVKIEQCLNDIKKHHEDCTDNELLIWALATAARNEQHTFNMFNLKDYKKRNPDFFTSKQFQI